MCLEQLTGLAFCFRSDVTENNQVYKRLKEKWQKIFLKITIKLKDKDLDPEAQSQGQSLFK